MSDRIEGLFLKSTKYAENSLIVDLLTDFHGKKSFLFKSVQSKKRSFIFQPFHVIEFSCKFNSNKNINSGFSPELCFPIYNIISDIRKTTNALFLTELLYKTINKNEPSEKLFFHLKKIILSFEHLDFNSSFSIFFIKEILPFIGLQPINNYSEKNKFFNLKDGNFSSNSESIYDPLFSDFLFSKLLGMNIDKYNLMNFAKQDRKAIMSILLDYLNYHANVNSSDIKSLKILYSLYD